MKMLRVGSDWPGWSRSVTHLVMCCKTFASAAKAIMELFASTGTSMIAEFCPAVAAVEEQRRFPVRVGDLALRIGEDARHGHGPHQIIAPHDLLVEHLLKEVDPVLERSHLLDQRIEQRRQLVAKHAQLSVGRTTAVSERAGERAHVGASLHPDTPSFHAAHAGNPSTFVRAFRAPRASRAAARTELRQSNRPTVADAYGSP